MLGMLKSRKVVAAIIGLILIFANAYLSNTSVDQETLTNAVMGIIAALMASIAWEDGKKAEAAGTSSVQVNDPGQVVVTTPVEKIQ
jgi:uncharacterized membrane protein